MRSFFLKKFGKRQSAFGKKFANLSFKFEVLIVGEIVFCPRSFLLGKKSLVKSTPGIV